MSDKLPIVATLRESIHLALQNRGDLLRVGLVFIAGFFGLGAIALNTLLPALMASSAGPDTPVALDPRLPAGMLLIVVIEFLLFAVFAVGWHRVVLLGSASTGRGLGVQLGARELRYFGRLWLCFAASFAIAFVVAFVELLIGRAVSASPQALINGAELAYMLASAYVFGRLGPSFAALAIDRPLSFRESWAATRGNGLRILGAYLLASAAWLGLNLLLGQLASLVGLGDSAPYTLLLVGAILLCGMLAVMVGVNAIVYRRYGASIGRTGREIGLP